MLLSRIFFVMLLLLLASLVHGADIHYRIYVLAEQPTLLAEGNRVYDLEDIRVINAGTHYRKFLSIADGFTLGASVFPEENVDGFGLWIKKQPEWWEFWSDGGFSWEWFDRVSDDTFRKRQGAGLVKVAFTKRDGRFELASVQFIQAVTFRLNTRPWFFFSHDDTHHMQVLAGSEFQILASPEQSKE